MLGHLVVAGRRQGLPCPHSVRAGENNHDLLCSALSVPVVSSDSDSDSDLSSSSLEDRPMPSGIKGTKYDKPRGDSGKCGEICYLFLDPEVLSGIWFLWWQLLESRLLCM